MQPTFSILFFSKSLNLFIPFFYFLLSFIWICHYTYFLYHFINIVFVSFFKYFSLCFFILFLSSFLFFYFHLVFPSFSFFYSFISICLFLLLIFNSVSLSIYFWHSLFSFWPRNWFRGKFLLISQFKMDFKILADLFPEILFWKSPSTSNILEVYTMIAM
jgi:hypothetical protein